MTAAASFDRAYYEVPRTAACPFCRSPRGSDCRSIGGYTVGFHAARIKAVAHLNRQQRDDAVQKLRAEEKARRDKTEAILAKPLTADQLATRAAIDAGFQQIKEAARAREKQMYARCRDPWLHNEACECRLGRPYAHPEPKPRVIRDVTDLAEVRARLSEAGEQALADALAELAGAR
ncbi:hypothetical protein ACWT_5661 [Actinoplanes sp. SE50]|uniref:zinc finger domain-containing protein n=1 Tax=unclassified Actinoplanes TaxID=2626549 RepID=UPI00023ED2BC|nr:MULTISPECIES: hypothetical protein [unclassified Actinoplanes]AEV86678.1 hypothetical protein ACPL_5791 [Actinoplanes sp. SE50/110]ATO85076.1 hypothetical protein ACWT_5661 [Actinoplanes sp. SE50]SLM02487.1 hypothetical protein ACSP50_5737 [Actinoplanes sp. SE50/110]